jgi:hypothetical protein
MFRVWFPPLKSVALTLSQNDFPKVPKPPQMLQQQSA